MFIQDYINMTGLAKVMCMSVDLVPYDSKLVYHYCFGLKGY
jgi:hypothetical protein